MNQELALTKVQQVIQLIDRYGALYDSAWSGVSSREDLRPQVAALEDEVRRSSRMCFDIARGMGEKALASQISEHPEGAYGGHSWQQARDAIVEIEAILAQREELAEIMGPIGPSLDAKALHPTIWSSAAALWDGAHIRAAVQTAAQALEGLLQAIAGPAISGENLAALFSTNDPTLDSPRLRLREIDPASKTWRSAQEGLTALVRGAFMGVRNLVSHPGWPDPPVDEALEMLALLSYIARMIDRSDIVRAIPDAG